MTASVSAYSVIHAVTRALYADLFSEGMWHSLIQAPDYDAVLGLLSKSNYAPYLEVSRSLLTPRRAVYQIRQHLAYVYTKLIHLAPSSSGHVLESLWHHYEVDNIKAALRGYQAGASWDQVLHLLYPMDRHSVADVDRLSRIVQADDIEQAVEALRGTPYHQILLHALTRYHEERSLFPLEVALDLGYRRSLWERILGLRGLDRKMAQRTIGTVLDSDNLLWAIRYRVYHHLSEEEIINYTLPMGYEITDHNIRTIARGGRIADVVFGVYPELADELKDVTMDTGGGLRRLERALLQLALSRCRKAFAGYPFHIGIPLGYVWLNEHEIRDLTIIIEAKAAGTPLETFLPMLVMTRLV